MHVAINNQRTLDFAGSLQRANRHADIVENAEARAVFEAGVVTAASGVGRQAVLQRQLPC